MKTPLEIHNEINEFVFWDAANFKDGFAEEEVMRILRDWYNELRDFEMVEES